MRGNFKIESQNWKRKMHFWVKQTVREMKWEDALPEGHYYHTYRGFWNLLTRTDWEKTDGVVKYDLNHTAT
jgi:hypothetical protein